MLTDATGWNNPKNCELWRSEWAKVCNEHLPLHNQVDHRSYEKQGKLQIPTIHEGADARKIEQKFFAGQEIKGSWKVAENQIIKQQNTLLQKILNTFGKVSGALSLWKERLNDIRRKPGNYTLKICYLTQERDYARTHQKIVEIPVEKPVLYEKCEACNRTAYQNAKAKYETQKERLAGQYKAKTVMFQTTLFLLAWYSLTTTLFQAVQSDMFLVDCKSFFNDLASFIQTFVGWTIDAGHSAAQISTKIPNAFIAGMVYWLLLILIVGICMAGTGMLAILIEIKVIELYKKNCWDVITLLMILTSAAVIIYFGEVIKKALSINLLFFWLILQGIYLTIRRYISQDTD